MDLWSTDMETFYRICRHIFIGVVQSTLLIVGAFVLLAAFIYGLTYMGFDPREWQPLTQIIVIILVSAEWGKMVEALIPND
jgi:ABC-type glucose/galactose transport system permease subunit